MKQFIVLAAFLSLTAQASMLSSFNVIRQGGGQIEAVVAESDEGMEITLVSCGFRDAPANTSAKVIGSSIVKAARTILAGRAIIAEDVSPAHQMETGSWSKMSYTLNANEFPEITEPSELTKEVKAPVIVINGKHSHVLGDLEVQARKLCK